MIYPLILLLVPWLKEAPISSQVVVMAADTEPLTWLLNLGTAGVWLICFLTGLVPTKAELTRIAAENERLIEDGKAKDKAIETLVSLMTSRTLPSLAAAVAEMPVATAAQQESALGKRLEDALSRVERVLGDERSS